MGCFQKLNNEDLYENPTPRCRCLEVSRGLTLHPCLHLVCVDYIRALASTACAHAGGYCLRRDESDETAVGASRHGLIRHGSREFAHVVRAHVKTVTVTLAVACDAEAPLFRASYVFIAANEIACCKRARVRVVFARLRESVRMLYLGSSLLLRMCPHATHCQSTAASKVHEGHRSRCPATSTHPILVVVVVVVVRT